MIVTSLEIMLKWLGGFWLRGVKSENIMLLNIDASQSLSHSKYGSHCVYNWLPLSQVPTHTHSLPLPLPLYINQTLKQWMIHVWLQQKAQQQRTHILKIWASPSRSSREIQKNTRFKWSLALPTLCPTAKCAVWVNTFFIIFSIYRLLCCTSIKYIPPPLLTIRNRLSIL